MSSPHEFIIETASLRLRRFRIDDAEWAARLDADEEVMRFISGSVPTPRETFLNEYLPRMLRICDLGPQFGFWTGEDRESGRPTGWFHLRPEKQEPFAMELGYRLQRESWGKGLATEGSRELLRRAFTEWGVARVVAHTLAMNLPSRRVMEKCGMRLEREFIGPADWHHGWTEEQRRAVRYQIDAVDFEVKSRNW